MRNHWIFGDVSHDLKMFILFFLYLPEIWAWNRFCVRNVYSHWNEEDNKWVKLENISVCYTTTTSDKLKCGFWHLECCSDCWQWRLPLGSFDDAPGNVHLCHLWERMPLQWGVGDRMRKLRLQGEAACIYPGHSRQRQTQSGDDLGMKVWYTGIPSRWLFTIIYILPLDFFLGPFFVSLMGWSWFQCLTPMPSPELLRETETCYPKSEACFDPFAVTCDMAAVACASLPFWKKSESCHLSTLSMLQHVTVGVFLNMFLTFEFQRTAATCQQKSLALPGNDETDARLRNGRV